MFHCEKYGLKSIMLKYKSTLSKKSEEKKLW